MKRTTIRTFDELIAAHILQNRLEDEGIPCYIFDGNIVSVNPLFSNAVGGIKVKVDDENLEKARAILKEIDDTPLTNELDEIISCPNCESTNLILNFKSFKGIGGIFSALISFILVIFPIYYKNVRHCKDCECEFE